MRYGSVALALLAVITVVGCGGAAEAAPQTVVIKHVPVPAPAPAPLASPYAVGDAVVVEYGGTWYPAHVRTVLPDGRWEIAYDGWGTEWNQLVGPDRIAKEAPAPPGAGRAVQSLAEIEPGTAVMVSWNGSWYPGHVRAVTRERQVWVGYDGFGDEWDEAVGLDRLGHL